MGTFIFALQFLFVFLFWNMSTVAADEGRPSWAFVYLAISAINGAAALSSFF